MRILLDESAPHEIRHWLWEHDVQTTTFRHWNGLKDADLIRTANAEFDLLITADKNLPHQQNIAATKLAVLVLPTNNATRLRSRIAELRLSIHRCAPGRIEWLR